MNREKKCQNSAKKNGAKNSTTKKKKMARKS